MADDQDMFDDRDDMASMDRIDSSSSDNNDSDDEDGVNEQSNMETPIPRTNKGYKLMLRLGWREGTGLGARSQGPVDPLPILTKDDTLGLGKTDEMMQFHVEATASRRATEAEKIAVETDQDRIDREIKVQRIEAIRDELKTVNAAFYCELCTKQYQRISDYETHLSSYDHHHRKRLKEMREASRRHGLLGQERMQVERDAVAEKERAREMREMQRIQQAFQSRHDMASPSTTSSTTNATSSESANDSSKTTNSSQPAKPVAFAFAKKTAVGGPAGTGFRISLGGAYIQKKPAS